MTEITPLQPSRSLDVRSRAHWGSGFWYECNRGGGKIGETGALEQLLNGGAIKCSCLGKELYKDNVINIMLIL